MLRARRARDKRSRVRKAVRRGPKKLTLLLLEIEAPLNDAIRYVQALHLEGLMLECDNAGEPMAAVAWLASPRLEIEAVEVSELQDDLYVLKASQDLLCIFGSPISSKYVIRHWNSQMMLGKA